MSVHSGPAGMREVVSSLDRQPPSMFTVSAHVMELLAASTWKQRLACLGYHPHLLHRSVAERCRAEGQDPLARFIERAVDTGIEAAAANELPTLNLLASIAETDGEPATLQTLRVAADVITANSATWIIPEFLVVAAALAHRNIGGPADFDALRTILIPPLATASCASTDAVHDVLSLAFATDDIWVRLPDLVRRTDLLPACPAAQAVAALSIDVPNWDLWVADVADLLRAAAARGPDAAAREHLLVITARALAGEEDLADGPHERAALCAQMATDAALYHDETGASWVLPSALEAARVAVELTDGPSEDRARRLSNLSALIDESIQSGVLEFSQLQEAVDSAEEAYALTPATHPFAARYAMNLGNRIYHGIQGGLLDPSSFARAVALQEQARDATPPEDPQWVWRTNNLSALLAEAAITGNVPLADLARSVQLARVVLGHPGVTEANRPRLQSNLSNRIVQAVAHSVLPTTALLEGIDQARAAAEAVPLQHPHYGGFASNLSALLSDGFRAGVVPARSLVEAVALAQKALEITPRDHVDRAIFATNLASRIAVGVSTGTLTRDHLAQAVDAAQEAVDLTPTNHPQRTGRLTNLAGRALEAVAAGVVEPQRFIALVNVVENEWLLTPVGHPGRASLATDLAVLFSEAVSLGALPTRKLVDAVDLASEGLRHTDPDRPEWASSASNFAVILSEAVQAKAVAADRFDEAVWQARNALAHVPRGTSAWAVVASNASALLAEAMAAGTLDASHLAEAVELQQEALDLVPFPHPDRPAYAANLGARVAEALAQGLLTPLDARSRIERLVDDAWRDATTCVTPLQRRRMVTLTSRLATRAPLVLAHTPGAPEEVALAIEVLRGHLQSGMRAPQLPPGAVSQEAAQAYAVATREFEFAQQRARDGVSDFTQTLPAAHALQEAIVRIRVENPAIDLAARPTTKDLVAALPAGAAVVYLVAGNSVPEDGAPDSPGLPGVAVVLGPNGYFSITLHGLSRDSVAERVGDVIAGSEPLEQVAEWMWDQVIAPLQAAAAEPGHESLRLTEWVLIPTGALAMLPWHASGRRERWIDDDVTVRTLPNLLSRPGLRSGLSPASGGSVAMALPAVDLELLQADMAVAQAFLIDCEVLAEQTGAEGLLSALAEARATVLSGHALHALDKGAGLLLGPMGAGLWLTADDVERLPPRHRDVALLSACSSGQLSTSLPEEVIGLPTALLGVGFRSVVSTLWPVRDSVAFLTTARFLQVRSTHPEESDAALLRQVRRWLRETTSAELMAWLADLHDSVPLPEEARVRLTREWRRLAIMGHRKPYAAVRDWAPFFCLTDTKSRQF